jgi:hypothetical protein
MFKVTTSSHAVDEVFNFRNAPVNVPLEVIDNYDQSTHMNSQFTYKLGDIVIILQSVVGDKRYILTQNPERLLHVPEYECTFKLSNKDYTITYSPD